MMNSKEDKTLKEQVDNVKLEPTSGSDVGEWRLGGAKGA